MSFVYVQYCIKDNVKGFREKFPLLHIIQVSVLFLNNIGLSMSGLLIIACPLCISYYQLLMVSITLGLFTCKLVVLKGISDTKANHSVCKIACTAVTRPILLGELLGLENVNNAYGFMLVFYGVATLFGTPMAGITKPILNLILQ